MPLALRLEKAIVWPGPKIQRAVTIGVVGCGIGEQDFVFRIYGGLGQLIVVCESYILVCYIDQLLKGVCSRVFLLLWEGVCCVAKAFLPSVKICLGFEFTPFVYAQHICSSSKI